MKIGGIPIVDATKKMKVTILPVDVRRGDNKNPDGCAAARACVRQINGVVAAKVHIARTYLKFKDKKTKKEKWVRFGTPASVRGEIIGFDRGGSFEPGDYKFPPSTTECQIWRAAASIRQVQGQPARQAQPKVQASSRSEYSRPRPILLNALALWPT